MIHRLSLLLAMMLAMVGFTVLVPARPASAASACGGTGVMDITSPGPGLLYPVGVQTSTMTTTELPVTVTNIPTVTTTTAPFVTALTVGVTVTTSTLDQHATLTALLGTGSPMYTFAFNFTTGVCVSLTTSKTFAATGVVKGYCSYSSGFGVLSNGDLFAWVGVGDNLVLTGHLVGLFNVAPDTGESCAHTSPTELAGGALTFLANGTMVKLNCDSTLQTLVPMTPDDFTTLVPLITTQVLNAVSHLFVDFGLHFYWNHLCFGSPVL